MDPEVSNHDSSSQEHFEIKPITNLPNEPSSDNHRESASDHEGEPDHDDQEMADESRDCNESPLLYQLNSTRKITQKEQSQSQMRKKLIEQAATIVSEMQTLDIDLLATLNKKRDCDLSKTEMFLTCRPTNERRLFLALYCPHLLPKNRRSSSPSPP